MDGEMRLAEEPASYCNLLRSKTSDERYNRVEGGSMGSVGR